METRLKSLEDTLSTNVVRTMTVQEKVDGMTSYANAARPMPPPTQLPLRLAERPATIQTRTNDTMQGNSTHDPTTVHRKRRIGHKSHLTRAVRQYVIRIDSCNCSSQMSVNSVQSTSSATFEIPAGHQRKQRRRAKAVVGTGTSGNVRGAPEPSRDIFIFRVDKTTDADNMKRYMNNKNIDVREIELKSKEQSLYNSFLCTYQGN